MVIHVLILGCGYGAIGITMAKCSETANVYMVDKDFVAVDYARKNVKQNHLQNCNVLLSNGFSHLPDIQFDVIASKSTCKCWQRTSTDFLLRCETTP